MVVTISSKGQLIVPAPIRKHKKIEPGDKLELVETENGFQVTKMGKGLGRHKPGLLAYLRSCPVKSGWAPGTKKDFTKERKF